MEGKDPRKSHNTYEGMDMSVRAERRIKFGEDNLKCTGQGIKEGGWWIPRVPTDDAWVSKDQHNHQHYKPFLIN